MMNDIDCDDGNDGVDDAGGMGDGAQGANDWDGDQKYVAQQLDDDDDDDDDGDGDDGDGDSDDE